LARETLSAPPIWMMRQAGRYHSHYQALRKKHSFMDLCLRPELASEVAMGPVQEFDFDAAILFSDILFPLKAFGMPLEYTDAGPQLGYQLNESNLHALRPWQDAIHEMEFQKRALQMTREKLTASKGLIGFVGGPWTLFVYAMEGSHAGNLLRSKTSWNLWQAFEAMIFPFLRENIYLQLEGGADVVMIFDTAAGELSPTLFQTKLQPILSSLAHEFAGKIGYYSKGTTAAHFDLAWEKIPWAGQGFDHRQDLPKVLSKSDKGFCQGNFDQGLLHLDSSQFSEFMAEFLRPFQDLSPAERRGWICGLGHGVLPKTPEKNVHQFVELVRKSFA
jgi:uroporphyrinogen decarboxylase